MLAGGGGGGRRKGEGEERRTEGLDGVWYRVELGAVEGWRGHAGRGGMAAYVGIMSWKWSDCWSCCCCIVEVGLASSNNG